MVLWSKHFFISQNEVESGILGIYQAFAEKTGSSRCKQMPILLREKHGSFLRRGLTRLSDAYEVRKLLMYP